MTGETRGRVSLHVPTKTQRSLYLDDDTWDIARGFTDRTGVAHSEVIRRAIRLGLPEAMAQVEAELAVRFGGQRGETVPG